MENLVVREYLGSSIQFKMVEGHVYANANKMAEAFGGSQKLKDWKRSENTKRYIEALEKVMGKNSTSQLILTQKGNSREFEQGTWIHEKLILNFARYLNVEFELWCDEQIATLLREGKVEVKQKVVKTQIPYNPAEILKDTVSEYNQMIEELGLNIPKEIILSVGITTASKISGVSYDEVKALTNKVDEESYHSPSALLSELNIKRNRTNESLVLLGLQIKGTTSMQPYILTELGKEYGVERSYNNNGHQGYEIKYKSSLTNFVKEHINEIPSEWIKK